MTMHDLRLRTEARALARRAAEILGRRSVGDADLEAALRCFNEASNTLHELIIARLRGDKSTEQPKRVS